MHQRSLNPNKSMAQQSLKVASTFNPGSKSSFYVGGYHQSRPMSGDTHASSQVKSGVPIGKMKRMLGTNSKESFSNSYQRTNHDNTLDQHNIAIQNHDFINDTDRSMPIKIGEQQHHGVKSLRTYLSRKVPSAGNVKSLANVSTVQDTYQGQSSHSREVLSHDYN